MDSLAEWVTEERDSEHEDRAVEMTHVHSM
jgi:hypothetical protein